jgi:CheY-like chemotaxis protein
MFTKNILHMYSKTILIVDDMRLFRKMAEDIFRREQVNVIKAQSGHEAVELIIKEKPDLVFMDLYMSGGNGDEACREIKSDHSLRSIPIIMVTSSDNPDDIERCRKAGCDDFIHKPFTRESLLNTSRKFINFPGWSGKRAKIKAPVRYGTNPEALLAGILTDISVGGLFLETEEVISVGSELHLEIMLRQNLAPIQCKGRVTWINRKSNPREDHVSPGVGIEFIDIKKLDILAVQALVSKSL